MIVLSHISVMTWTIPARAPGMPPPSPVFPARIRIWFIVGRCTSCVIERDLLREDLRTASFFSFSSTELAHANTLGQPPEQLVVETVERSQDNRLEESR
jgi:hypothetical protein